jgi:hypothetical protein
MDCNCCAWLWNMLSGGASAPDGEEAPLNRGRPAHHNAVFDQLEQALLQTPLLEQTRGKFHKGLSDLPCHIDFPRLVSKMRIHLGSENDSRLVLPDTFAQLSRCEQMRAVIDSIVTLYALEPEHAARVRQLALEHLSNDGGDLGGQVRMTRNYDVLNVCSAR